MHEPSHLPEGFPNPQNKSHAAPAQWLPPAPTPPPRPCANRSASLQRLLSRAKGNAKAGARGTGSSRRAQVVGVGVQSWLGDRVLFLKGGGSGSLDHPREQHHPRSSRSADSFQIILLIYRSIYSTRYYIDFHKPKVLQVI